MIRKSIMLVLAVFFSSMVSYAGEQKIVKLDNSSHMKEMITLSYYNIFVSLADVSSDDNVKINIEVENISDNYCLLLFDKSYDEKSLKKGFPYMRIPSTRYEKGRFPGNSGKRFVEKCDGAKQSYALPISEKMIVATLDGAPGRDMVCRLPVYFAKCKGKNCSKLLLQELDVVELIVNVNLGPDKELEELTRKVNALKKEIKNTSFCKNAKHRGTKYEKLKSDYENKIDDLKRDINNVISKRNYMSTDGAYKKYNDLVEQLKAIDIEKMSVSKCRKCKTGSTPPSGHSCGYCSQSFRQLHGTLQNIQIDIHNGKTTAGKVKSKVDAIKTCMSNCTKRSDDGFRSKCNKDINDILK